jgi:hypothetical protein
MSPVDSANADMFGTLLGPTAQPVLAPHRDDSQRPFRVIGIDGDIRVTQIHRESSAALTNVIECLGKWAAWQKALFLKLLAAPLEDGLHNWLGMGLPPYADVAAGLANPTNATEL